MKKECGVFQVGLYIVDKSRVALCQRMLNLCGFWGIFETYVCQLDLKHAKNVMVSYCKEVFL